ncbi:MAG: glycosyltransferase family 9 protein [Chitinophagaceae bacterium]
MDKILVIQTAFIGDVVLATALLESLHEAYPKAEIDILIRKGNEGLFNNHPFLHKVWIWNKKHKKYRNLLKMALTIRKSRFDLVINLQRYAATGFLTAFSKAKYRIGFNKNPFKKWFTHAITHQFDGLHEIERNHLLLSPFKKITLIPSKLHPSKADYSKVAPLKSMPYICIAPASVWYTKQLPAKKWIEFVHQLTTDVKVYLLGAASDNDICHEIASECSHLNIENLAGELTFLESAALMKDALMNYTNDSAPLHFASAMNAPITAIYCSTIPAFGYGPKSEESNIIETKEDLSCRPCGLHGHNQCPKQHFNCANSIQTQQLLAVLQSKFTSIKN